MARVADHRHEERPQAIIVGNPVERFALQADFDVTSDMLGLHPTSAWNHWLLSCTARLFVLAFLADQMQSPGPDDDAGDQVAEDRAEPEALGHRHRDDGGG